MSYPRFFAQQGERLIDNGYPIIPIVPGAKNPSIEAWQTASITRDLVRSMGANGHAYDGVGIQTAYVPAIDIDIYDETTANVMSDWVDAHIGLGLMREGQFPKRLLAFRTDTPFVKTFSASYSIPGTTQLSKIEILGQGQQFVAFGVHPDTHSPYVWPDESVLERNYWSLPVLTHEAAKSVCAAFESYAATLGLTPVKPGNWQAARAATYSDDPLDRKSARADITEEQIREALALLDVAQYSEYGEWVRVGQMLHHQFEGSPDGLAIYDEWSATLDKYEGTDAVETKWNSFNEARNGGVVTIGSLLHEVKQIKEREAAKEEEIRKGMEAYLFRELELEVSGFTGDWFDFKSGQIVTHIKRFLGNVIDQADAERYLSKLGKTIADRKFDGTPAKASIERELKPGYRKAGAAPGAVSVVGAGVSGLPAYDTNRDGAILPTQGNVTLAMKSGGYAHFAYDEFLGQISVSQGGRPWRPLEDNDYPRALTWMESQGFNNVAKERVKDGIAVVADDNRFDSAINWGNSLVWDRVERIRKFSSAYLGLPDTDYHVSVWYYAWSAMAARLLNPDTQIDMVPVLVSKEGMRKSTFVKTLAPFEEAFGMLDMSKKDDDISRSIRGKLVLEWAEMKGLKGRDEETVKAFVTQRFQAWVPKFKEMETRYYRRCFFIGTANNSDLLPAHGENRRWLPILLLQMINIAALEADRDQLWAEAIQVFKHYGVQWEAAHNLAVLEREDYREDDPLADQIADWLDSAAFEGNADGTAKRGDSAFRMADLQNALEQKGVKNVTPNRIGQRLGSLGYERFNARNGKFVAKFWRRKR